MKKSIVIFGYGQRGKIYANYSKFREEEFKIVAIIENNPKKTDEIVNELPEDCEIKNMPLPLALCPEAYWRVAKQYWWGKYAFPIIFLLLRIILFGYKCIITPRRKYDVAIAFSGHLNDLSFVAYDFLKAKKKCCWLHLPPISYSIP